MNVAVYAGTFDPVTLGHESIISQAAKLFVHLRVLVAVHPTKKPTFNLVERVAMLKEALRRMPNVSVDSTEGLVAEYASRIGACVLVRGVRDAADAEAETSLAYLNRKIAPNLPTILLPAEPGLSTVSSRELKRLVVEGKDVSLYCNEQICQKLLSRLHRKASA